MRMFKVILGWSDPLGYLPYLLLFFSVVAVIYILTKVGKG